MKFSVLLPTRNRLEYLPYAVETVRRQDYDNWEIIVSDNFSEQDIAGYVRSIGDKRIKYLRTDRPLSVTENWNNALKWSTGEYVVMLGDDDGLLQRYFTTMLDMVHQYDWPDFIYSAAFLYAYPGVVPGYPNGFLRTHPGATFLQSAPGPFWLEKHQMVELARQCLDFRMPLNCNMQHSIVSRTLIDKLRDRGEVFQSPFPDYYATNSMLLAAQRGLVCPRPLVAIGISPKSYGFFHANQRETEGIEFLGSTPGARETERLDCVVLPGTNINTSWLFAMEAIKDNFGAEFDLHVNYRRYRMLQIVHGFKERHLERRLSDADFRRLLDRMRLWEKVVFGGGLSVLTFALKLVPAHYRERVANKLFFELTRQYPGLTSRQSKGRFSNILEVFEQTDPLGV